MTAEPDTDAGLTLGDFVRTIKGARFTGKIIALDNDPLSPGCTVLATHIDFTGTKHVYPLKQLERAVGNSRALAAEARLTGMEAEAMAVRETLALALFVKWSGEAMGWPDAGDWIEPDFEAWEANGTLNDFSLCRQDFYEEADHLLAVMRARAAGVREHE